VVSSTLDFGRFTSFLLLLLFCSLRVCHVYNMATGSGEDISGFVKEAVKENNDKLLANIISKISAKPSAVSLLDAPRFKRKVTRNNLNATLS